MSLAGNEIFSLEELGQLNLTQLRRVVGYLGIEVRSNARRPEVIEAIMNFQRRPEYYSGNLSGNPDWKEGVQRSVRVQRLYELNVLGKKL